MRLMLFLLMYGELNRKGEYKLLGGRWIFQAMSGAFCLEKGGTRKRVEMLETQTQRWYYALFRGRVCTGCGGAHSYHIYLS
jgi:hypothetical protein